MIGTSTASKHEELTSKTTGKTKIGTFEDAAKFGEIVVLATKGTAAEAALKVAGVANLKGKTVIDTTNAIADAAPVNGVLQYFTSQNESLMERLQALAAKAHFVKAFSCIGNAFMVNPDFNGVKPTMFIVRQRTAPTRPRLRPIDRLVWRLLSSVWPNWRQAVPIVTPATLVRWHRRAFAA